MFKMARFATYIGLGLAISSLIGLMARHLTPIGVGYWTLLILLIVLVLMSYFAGPLLDHHFGWVQDTTLGLAIALFLIFILGGIIGWLIS